MSLVKYFAKYIFYVEKFYRLFSHQQKLSIMLLGIKNPKLLGFTTYELTIFSLMFYILNMRALIANVQCKARVCLVNIYFMMFFQFVY